MNAIEIAKAAVAVAEKFYSEDQPRDASGKWGGGSATGKAAENAKGQAAHAAAEKHHDAMMNSFPGAKTPEMNRVINAHANAAAAHGEAARTNTKSDGAYARKASERAYALHDKLVQAPKR